MAGTRGFTTARFSRMTAYGFVLGLGLGAVAPLSGMPAAPGTLSDYLALGPGGATIGTTLFSDFLLGPMQNGATPISPDAVQVVPLDVPGKPGLEFIISQSAAGSDLLELSLLYHVTGDPLQLAINSMSDAAATGNGAVTSVEEIGAGGPPVPPLIAFAIDGLADPIVQQAFSASSLDVALDVVIDGGLTGTASLGGVTNQFVL